MYVCMNISHLLYKWVMSKFTHTMNGVSALNYTTNTFECLGKKKWEVRYTMYMYMCCTCANTCTCV